MNWDGMPKRTTIMVLPMCVIRAVESSVLNIATVKARHCSCLVFIEQIEHPGPISALRCQEETGQFCHISASICPAQPLG